MTSHKRHRFGALRTRALPLPSLVVVSLTAAAFVLAAAAVWVVVVGPAVAWVSDCTTRADDVATDVRVAVEASVGAKPSGSSVEACEGGHHVEVGLDFAVESREDLRGALTRDGCRPSASTTLGEFACRWEQDGHSIEILVIREGTSVVAYVDL